MVNAERNFFLSTTPKLIYIAKVMGDIREHGQEVMITNDALKLRNEKVVSISRSCGLLPLVHPGAKLEIRQAL